MKENRFDNKTIQMAQSGNMFALKNILKNSTVFSINGMAIDFNGPYTIYTGVPLLLPVKAGDTYTSTSWTLDQFKFIPNR